MRTAVVVGAGIAGLATAGALARTGWSVTLLEREPRLRPGRAALVLWPNGLRALRALGLADGIESVATPVTGGGIRHPDGHWLLPPERAWSASGVERPVVVHREDLYEACVAGLGEQVDVRTGVQIRTARPGQQRPTVSDGRVNYEADLVVGADGVDSAIRRRLASSSVFVSAGHAAWRAVIPWYRAPKLPEGVGPSGEILGAGHRFSYLSFGVPGSSAGASSARAGIYWVATAPGAPRPEPARTQLALLGRWLAGWPAPTGELLAGTEPEDIVQHGVGELRPLPPAFGFPSGTGGYALVGDAAHAMTHYLGQGACLALEDAATLTSVVRQAVPGEGLGAALEAYSRQRRPRVTRVLARSRRVSSILRIRGGLAGRARVLAMGRLMPRMLDRASAEATEWQPPPD